MSDNAAKRAMSGLKQDEAYNFLTGEIRGAAPRVGKKAKSVLGRMPTQTAGPVMGFREVWGSASQEQKNRWTGQLEPVPPKDEYEYLLKLWNSGQIDGIKHNDNIRMIMGE